MAAAIAKGSDLITKLNGDASEQKVLDMMKRLGVLEYFKKQKAEKIALS